MNSLRYALMEDQTRATALTRIVVSGLVSSCSVLDFNKSGVARSDETFQLLVLGNYQSHRAI